MNYYTAAAEREERAAERAHKLKHILGDRMKRAGAAGKADKAAELETRRDIAALDWEIHTARAGTYRRAAKSSPSTKAGKCFNCSALIPIYPDDTDPKWNLCEECQRERDRAAAEYTEATEWAHESPPL